MVGIIIILLSMIVGMIGSTFAERKVIEYLGTILEDDYRKLFNFWLWFGTIGVIIGVILTVYGI